MRHQTERTSPLAGRGAPENCNSINKDRAPCNMSSAWGAHLDHDSSLDTRTLNQKVQAWSMSL